MPDRIPTLADVCSAIAEGQISFSTDGATYQISALELRRYRNKQHSLPSITALLTETPTPTIDSSVQSSVA